MRIIRLGNSAPKRYEPGRLGDDPVLTVDQPKFDTYTEISVSNDSTLLQAIAEIITIWNIHSHNGFPDWISGNDNTLVTVVADEFKLKDIREFTLS